MYAMKKYAYYRRTRALPANPAPKSTSRRFPTLRSRGYLHHTKQKHLAIVTGRLGRRRDVVRIRAVGIAAVPAREVAARLR